MALTPDRPMLEFQEVSFHWPENETPLWSRLSFTLNCGEGRYLDTPSGSGKSTLLKLAAGLLRPTQGKILRHTERIGMAFQDQRLLPWFTARQNLRFVMATPDDEKINSLLDTLELAHVADSPANTLSGGEAQRINLLRAILTDPELLLLDEPFTGLDERMTAKCAEFLRHWRTADAKHAFLLVTHLHISAKLCDAIPLFPS